ncbi:MAG: hypothetical protein V8Q65_06200, partial [Bacteroidaceae bacterium]
FVVPLTIVLLYISFGIDGIPWALLRGTFALLVSALHATTKLFPWNKNMFSASHLRAPAKPFWLSAFRMWRRDLPRAKNR